MTHLRALLASNMKENRRKLGISQAKLAEKASTSTQYVAMIELERKFPSPEMLERIAEALEIDAPQLFSIPPSPAGTLRKLHRSVLLDLKQEVAAAMEQAINEAYKKVFERHFHDADGI